VKRLIRGVVAGALGAALGFAAISPIQTARLASALCANDPVGAYDQLKDVGEDFDTLAQIMNLYFSECSGWSVRGAYINSDGGLSIIATVDDSFYVMTYDLTGTLVRIK
jgi:hypothetical protein